MKLEEYVRFNQLYDIYGKLLTQKQYEIVELHICDDLSLFEISEKLHITRQAVSDSLATARMRLEDYENKLCLLEKVNATRAATEKLFLLTEHIRTIDADMNTIVLTLKDIWKDNEGE